MGRKRHNRPGYESERLAQAGPETLLCLRTNVSCQPTHPPTLTIAAAMRRAASMDTFRTGPHIDGLTRADATGTKVSSFSPLNAMQWFSEISSRGFYTVANLPAKQAGISSQLV